MTKPFWTHSTIVTLVVFFTLASIAGNGIPVTAFLYVIVLGMFLTIKILVKEKL